MLVGAADQAGAPSDLLSNLLPPLLKLHELVEFEEQRDGASPLLPALRAALRDMDQAFAAHGVLRVAAVPGSPIDMADHEVAQLAVVGGVAAADLTALGDAVVHECLRPAYVHLSSGSVLKRALVTAERRPHELVDRLEPPRRLAGLTHAVQPGDTLQGLAVRYGVRVSAISRANNLASAQSMHARKELHIPPSATAGGSDAPGSGRPGLAATHVAGGAARIAVSAAQGQLTGPATAAPAAAPPSGCADMGAAVGATPRPTVLPPTPRGGQSGAVDTRSDAEQELARQEWFRYYCGARDWDGAESMAVTDADARTIARLRMLAAVPTRTTQLEEGVLYTGVASARGVRGRDAEGGTAPFAPGDEIAPAGPSMASRIAAKRRQASFERRAARAAASMSTPRGALAGS